MLSGPDVSNWQGSYDWAAEKRRGSDFGIAKATEGTGFRDQQFPRNWREMKRYGLVRGAYHFAQPSNSPIREAEHFVGYVKAHGLVDSDMLVLDLETADGRTPGQVAAFGRSWCERVLQITGHRPLVYTFLSFANAGNCAGLDRYPLWIADPSRPAGNPRVPSPWNDWTIHQHDQNPIDRNVARELPGDGGPTAKEVVDELLARDVFRPPWNLNEKWTFRWAVNSIWENAYDTNSNTKEILDTPAPAVVDSQTLAAQVLSVLTPDVIAASISDEQAELVLKLLADQL